MNVLMQARKDKSQQIKQCVNDLMELQKSHLEQKDSIEKMDVHAIGKMVSKAKLILQYKKDRRAIKKELEKLRDFNNSEFLFLVATHPIAIPVNEDTLDFPVNAQGHNLLVCYYYDYVSDRIGSHFVHDISGNRLGIKNEIDIQDFINITTHLNGKISREDETKVRKFVETYVQNKIQKENPQSWSELRTSVQKDSIENKNVFKKAERDSKMEF